MLPRRTLINPAAVQGRGLFTGRPVSAAFLPAPAGTGILFRRTDLPNSAAIPGTIASLAVQPPGIPARNTALGVGSAGVLTIEHALSALSGLGISDVIIELDGPELPIGDGSAAIFTEALWAAGLRYAAQDVAPLTISGEVTVEGAGGARITARPRSVAGCSYTYELDYGGGGVIAAQSATFDTARGDYRADIAPARTFCTLAEAQAMQKAGLFKDLTPRDLLVIGDAGPIDNAYLFENEPARHKVLDLIGDVSLVGRPLQLDIVAHRSGHALNHQLARALASPG
jgi:UDP-3-O-acyl N-acetylglucosamine deacetylase